MKHTGLLSGMTASFTEVSQRIIKAGKVDLLSLIILFFASLMICAGLSLNSITVMIGAMLVSQIYGSAAALALSVMMENLQLVRTKLMGLLFQIIVSILAAILYFECFSIDEPMAEIMKRIRTPEFDLMVAVSGGVIGTLGYAGKEKSNSVIFGATMSVILLPPLCILGYGVTILDAEMIQMAAVSFFINLYFICLTCAAVLFLLYRSELAEKQRTRCWVTLWLGIVLALAIVCVMVNK